MASENKIYAYEPLWGSWYVDEVIGEGSFGRVYKVHRDDFGERYYSAVKLITIPRNETEYAEVCSSGMGENTIRNYYQGYIQSIVGEMHMMQRLRGNSNIVSYEDHSVIENPYGVGADILVRMELLQPLNDFIAEHGMTARDVLQMGIDMCKALEVCQRYDIIHRDIKPGNIFISYSGSYKLGDFGIARVNNGFSELSKKGTFPYMAPEVYRGAPYDASIDLYSLGIVMYRLLNNNRLPFLPQPPHSVTYSDNEMALTRRLNGEAMPLPVNVKHGKIANIIMRACEFYPQGRYHSPEEMRIDLEDALMLLTDYRVLEPTGHSRPFTQPANNIPSPPPPPMNNFYSADYNQQDDKKNRYKKKRISGVQGKRIKDESMMYTPQRIRRMTENNRNSNIFHIGWNKFIDSPFSQWLASVPSRLADFWNEKFPSAQDKKRAIVMLAATLAAFVVIMVAVISITGGLGGKYVSATQDSVVGTWKQSKDEIVFSFNRDGTVESSEGKWQTYYGTYSVEGGNELIITTQDGELVYELKLYQNGEKMVLTSIYGEEYKLKKTD